MDVDGRLQRREAVDVLAAAGVWPRRSRERAADDEQEASTDENGSEPTELARNERRDVAFAGTASLEHEDNRARDEEHRQQQVRHHDRPAQVAPHRQVAERRLRERSDEERECEADGPARQRRR